MQGEKRALLEDISREEGGADVSLEEGIEGLTVWCHRRLHQNQEEKELAMHAVRKHTVSIGALTDRLLPQASEEANSRTQLLPALWAETSNTDFPHIIALSSAPIGPLKCSSQKC